MLACVDVDYRVSDAVAACVVFTDPGDALPLSEHVARVPISAPYQPGQLYLRELPPILAVLAQLTVSTIIVDGHVWLGPQQKGLGAHLHDAIHLPVIGVAKHAYRGAPAIPILRGQSRTPLFVTAVDYDPQRAAELIQNMHGPHRLPTLLKRVDRLSRTA
jgi:deoxyribonuclease V